MALTPQMIEAMNRATGNNVSPTGMPSVTSRADQIRELAKKSTATNPINEDPAITAGKSLISSFKDRGQNAIDIAKSTGADISTGAQQEIGGFKSGNVSDIVKGVGKQIRGTAEAGLQQVGNVAGAVGDIFGAGLKLMPGLNKVVENAGQSFLDSKNITGETNRETIAKLSKAAEEHPHLAKDIEASANILTLGGASAAEQPVKALVTDTAEGALNTAKNVTKRVAGKIKPAVEDLESVAIKDATPSFHPKLIGETITDAEGNIKPRINEAKGMGERTVNATQAEIDAGKELAKVKGYNPKDTSLNKFYAVKNDVISKAKELETSLKNEKILRPKREVKSIVKKAVDSASQDSLLLQKTDPIVKNYIRVTERALAQNDGTLYGELKVRRALDAAYEDAGGKYGNNKGLDQIHRAARNAINADIEKNAVTTSVKESLKQQSNLYKALDVLQDKATAEGNTVFQQFSKKHPVISGVAKKAGNLIGVGEAVKLAP